MQSDHKDCECTESGVKKMSQTWQRNHSLSHVRIREHGCRIFLECMITVTMFWDFGSAVTSQRQAAGDRVQTSVSRNLQQQEQLQDPQYPQQASGNCSRCQRRRCATLSQVTIQYFNQLWKVPTRRTHTISSTETS